MNFASSILGESPKFIDFRILSVNATGKPNFIFVPSNIEERLNGTGGAS